MGKTKSIEERVEHIHANASHALSMMADRTEFCKFYTMCLIDAETSDADESYKLALILGAEGHKDMGTEDPSDDEYVSLHDVSSCTVFDAADFKGAVKALIEMYGEKHVHPIIPDEYLRFYNIPNDYNMDDLFNLLDAVVDSDDWSLGAGFGIVIIEYID